MTLSVNKGRLKDNNDIVNDLTDKLLSRVKETLKDYDGDEIYNNNKNLVDATNIFKKQTPPPTKKKSWWTFTWPRWPRWHGGNKTRSSKRNRTRRRY
jgi:hypothetical protein